MNNITKKLILPVADIVEIVGTVLTNTATFIRDLAGSVPAPETKQEKEPDSIELSLRGNALVMFRRSQLNTKLDTRLHAHACISLGLMAAASCDNEEDIVALYNELENKAFPLALPVSDKTKISST